MKLGVAALGVLLAALSLGPWARAGVFLGETASLEATESLARHGQGALSTGRLETASAMAGRPVDGTGSMRLAVAGADQAGRPLLARAEDSAVERGDEGVPSPESGGGKRIGWGKGAVIAGSGILSALLGYGSDGWLGGIFWGLLGLSAAYLLFKGDYGGAIGTGLGALAGSFLGGPIGSMIGGVVGGIVGHFIGKWISGRSEKKEKENPPA